MKLSDFTDFVGLSDTLRKKPVEPENSLHDREDIGPKKSLLSWTAKSNVTLTKLDPRYKRTFMIIAIVLGLLFLAMQEYFLIIVIASTAFLYQVLSKNNLVEEVKYEISTHGISIDDGFYYWDELNRFFFSRSHGNNELLVVDLKSGLPSRIMLTYREEDRKHITDSMNKYIRYLEEEPLTAIDKAFNRVIDKFDFEQK